VSRAARLAATGATLGVVSLVIFAGLHALVVKPVWSQLLGGLPFVLAIGLGVTWAYDEFIVAVTPGPGTTGGLRFGAMMWLSSLPAVAFASVMRVQLGGPLPLWSEGAAVALALGGGAGIMGAVTRSRRAAIAAGVAAVALLAGGGGPLPILRGGRVAELWFGLFVLEAIGGAILAQLHRRWVPPRVAHPAP
jgi:hypothetical protein